MVMETIARFLSFCTQEESWSESCKETALQMYKHSLSHHGQENSVVELLHGRDVSGHVLDGSNDTKTGRRSRKDN